MIKCKHHDVTMERVEYERGYSGWECPVCRDERRDSLLTHFPREAPKEDFATRQMKAEIAEIEKRRQEGFMQSEKEWRKTLGFSDLSETKHYVDVCRAYFLKLHGNPYPPST